MKGLIRGGIRYFSNMFEEKEPELQIGNPTDVKHVAHIGWEGPDASKPSWMDGFHKSAPELEYGDSDSMEVVSRDAPISTDLSQGDKKPKKSRRSRQSASSPMNSPGRRSTEGTKLSAMSAESPKQHRRIRNLMSPKHSPSRDQAAIPKHSRPRKIKKDKKSSKDGPEASEAKSKQAKKSYASHLSSVLEAYEDEKPSQGSKGIMMVENSEFPTEAKREPVGIFVN